MSFFKDFFSKKEGFKEQFLAGWQLPMDDSEQCEGILLTQAIDKATANELESYVHLKYDKNDLLAEAKIYSEGELDRNEIINRNLHAESAIGIMRYRELPTHTSYNMGLDNQGYHQLGGEIPEDLVMPEARLVVPFQYLGFIDNKDVVFSWLPFKLHLICPIYLNFSALYIDYSNMLNPLILNKKEIEAADTSYDDDLNADSEIVFEERRFSLNTIVDYGLLVGRAGLANWVQYPDIPRCPKTHKVMKFLCQLHSNDLKTKRTNVVPKEEWYRDYYEKMNFWGDGDLYIFFEPESKVACYFIQHT